MTVDELIRLQELLCRFEDELQKGKDVFNSITDDEQANTASYYDGFSDVDVAMSIVTTCENIIHIDQC